MSVVASLKPTLQTTDSVGMYILEIKDEEDNSIRIKVIKE